MVSLSTAESEPYAAGTTASEGLGHEIVARAACFELDVKDPPHCSLTWCLDHQESNSVPSSSEFGESLLGSHRRKETRCSAEQGRSSRQRSRSQQSTGRKCARTPTSMYFRKLMYLLLTRTTKALRAAGRFRAAGEGWAAAFKFSGAWTRPRCARGPLNTHKISSSSSSSSSSWVRITNLSRGRTFSRNGRKHNSSSMPRAPGRRNLKVQST